MNYIQVQQLRKQAKINWANLGKAIRNPRGHMDVIRYAEKDVDWWKKVVNNAKWGGTDFPVNGSYEPGRPSGAFKADTEEHARNGAWNNYVYNTVLPFHLEDLKRAQQYLYDQKILQ